jgi:hypothetical protein
LNINAFETTYKIAIKEPIFSSSNKKPAAHAPAYPVNISIVIEALYSNKSKFASST